MLALQGYYENGRVELIGEAPERGKPEALEAGTKKEEAKPRSDESIPLGAPKPKSDEAIPMPPPKPKADDVIRLGAPSSDNAEK